MKLPLIILGLCTVIAGFIPFGKYVSTNGTELESHFDPVFSIVPVVFGLAGIVLAMWMYKNESARPEKLSAAFGGLYKTAYRKFYIDEIYLFITKKIIFNLIGRPAAWIDTNIVDCAMNGIAWTTGKTSTKIKGMQSATAQNYTLYFFGGIIRLTITFR